MAYHLVILAPLSSSDSVSWPVDQLEGSKSWTREIRSRNLVSAAGPEVSGQWQTNCIPRSFEAGLVAPLIIHSLASSSFTVASAISSFALGVRISLKEFMRAANAFLKFWQKSSQSLAEAWGAVFGTVFGAGGRFAR